MIAAAGALPTAGSTTLQARRCTAGAYGRVGSLVTAMIHGVGSVVFTSTGDGPVDAARSVSDASAIVTAPFYVAACGHSADTRT